MTWPFNNDPRPSIFLNDPAFRTPRTAQAIESNRKAYANNTFSGAIPWMSSGTITAFTRAVAPTKTTRKTK